MISEKALGLAIERDLITPAQADSLRSIEREVASASVEPADDEKLRFVTGFADIFVTIGVVLFLGALGYIMNAGAGSTLSYAGIASCAWLLAEFFTSKRRMALPSIVLLIVFVAAVFVLSAQIAASLLPDSHALGSASTFGVPGDNLPVGLAALVTIAMAALHYVRFRVPVTIAAGAAALCVLIVTIVYASIPNVTETALNVALLVCGLGVFALAMRFDMSDPARETRRTDIAFWLHLLAAPLIVHPLIRGLLHGVDGPMTTGTAVGILWIFLGLGAVAVVIDRRAILVSGLAYAGFAFGTLIRSLGFSHANLLVPTVLLTLGAFILLLSAGWQPLRRAIFRRLPLALSQRLPHPMQVSAT